MYLYAECGSEAAARVVTDGFVFYDAPVWIEREEGWTEVLIEFTTAFPDTTVPIVLRIDVPDDVLRAFDTAYLVPEEERGWDYSLTIAEADRYLPTLTALTNDGDELPLEAVNR